jgi:hypothetical protein
MKRERVGIVGQYAVVIESATGLVSADVIDLVITGGEVLYDANGKPFRHRFQSTHVYASTSTVGIDQVLAASKMGGNYAAQIIMDGQYDVLAVRPFDEIDIKYPL